MTTYVSNQSQLSAWNGTTNLNIEASFTISGSFNPINIISNGTITINGNYNTITIDSSITTFNGLFYINNSSTATINIKYLYIAYNGATVVGSGQGSIIGDCSSSGQFYTLNINQCSVTGTNYIINVFGGGIIGQNCGGNLSMTNCYIVGGSLSASSGGLVGYFAFGNSIYVYNCFSNISMTSGGGGCGGIICYLGSNDAIISNCYNLANMIGNANGGIIGSITDGHIYNCYNIGNINGNNSGGIAGNSNSTVFMNCYNTGTITGNSGGILGIGDTSTLNNVFSLNTTQLVGIQGLVHISNNTSINNSNYYNSNVWPVSSYVLQYLINNYDSFTNIWSDIDYNSPPILTGLFDFN